MGLLSRLFSKKDEGPVVVKGANDSAPPAASTPADDDIFPVPEAIRQFLIEQHGFDPLKNPLRPSVVCPEEHARRVEERRAVEEAMKNLEPGKLMPDGTVYLGRYSPVDRDNTSLAKIFNVFAAPENLPETMKYVDAVKYVASLEKWNGYDGANYATDTELYTAIKSGSYNGGWIIPTRDVLEGKGLHGNKTTPDNIFAHKNRGSFMGTFTLKGHIDSYHRPDRYWACTEFDVGAPYVRFVSFVHDDFGGWAHNNDIRQSCRPVRLVEVKMGG